ncbi:hypothetical protein DPSP01_001044 [Paraphaeosphaeria sporulosa]|uniref:Uncharacterized protein n=1 Tax=Paraphaeosphaeria sporulosa TaxID=1460663 RepID=A0A177C5C3_9PLEO|nr:uncharacterized protein CC84DRAFT_982252 [Paraphaeosphaeria sporulosa]OAG02089.1 hypothetical protein CC84DRAFT_982252 [Paraphaeosphaeria sporulosa]
MSVTYPGPLHPFPFPDDLPCGEPYINWPAHKDLVLSGNIQTEVAIPDSWVETGVGEDGRTNRTKEAYSLVMPRVRTIQCEQTKFVPMYRNKVFETSDDKFITPDKYYLEYMGSPALHTRSKNKCDIPYHLLSYQWSGSVMENYKLANYEGNDWLFHLYSGDTEEHYRMPTREPLAESEVIKVCDGRGRHRKYNKGKWPPYTCDFFDFEGPWPAPCAVPVVDAPKESSSVNLGLAIGLPVGIVGAIVLAILSWHLAPKLKRRFGGEGEIQL